MEDFTTPTVWLVDDDEDDQQFICSAFLNGDPSIHIRTLDDGEELLPALANCEQLPRLILLDINMPRQNGFETLEALRNSPAFAHLPVIMLTTSSADEDRQRSLRLGANQFMTKPLSYEQLRQMAHALSEQWALI
ncbi:response regulator [Spirosoma endophyticum]|uniref:Response regulator receiver domain-containing protein n=1 Tax=Spirosoma endophyticum TaxID=662367 RepID=A0A1I2GZ20_9BACT|nr:response regulator [Spirosoma endophyticum]SFF22518.1 Response regulator receiver domain-containing protein [Spirosoma endophyticum]